MIGKGDLATWTVREHREWADPPIGVVVDTYTCEGEQWYKITFLTGYRADQTFDIREQQIRRIEYD
tara:strand:+ start:1469 stop:1666 length:198 start_codon:yes stop_codon:yes gene_type:complete